MILQKEFTAAELQALAKADPTYAEAARIVAQQTSDPYQAKLREFSLGRKYETLLSQGLDDAQILQQLEQQRVEAQQRAVEFGRYMPDSVDAKTGLLKSDLPYANLLSANADLGAYLNQAKQNYAAYQQAKPELRQMKLGQSSPSANAALGSSPTPAPADSGSGFGSGSSAGSGLINSAINSGASNSTSGAAGVTPGSGITYSQSTPGSTSGTAGVTSGSGITFSASDSGSTSGTAGVTPGSGLTFSASDPGSTSGTAGVTPGSGVTYSQDEQGSTSGTAGVTPGSGTTYSQSTPGFTTGTADVTPGSGITFSGGTSASQSGSASASNPTSITYSSDTQGGLTGTAAVTGGNVTRNQPVLPNGYQSLTAPQKANLYASLRREGFTDSEIRTAAGNQSESDWQALRQLAGYDVAPGGTTTAATQVRNPAVTSGSTNRVAGNNWGGLLAEANNPMAAASMPPPNDPLRPGLINGNANPFATPQTRVQLPAGVTPWWPGGGGG